jgi:hypothetical protein
MAKKQPKNPIPIYQLKIVLREIEPPVWRILQIKGNASLGKLHDYIQGAMGWKDCHLHEFKIEGKRYMAKEQMDDDYDDDGFGSRGVYDERKWCLDKLLKEGDSFEYEYDFGDSWDHDILVEKIIPPKEEVYYPICTYGERACPPEDCGGTTGYEELIQVLNDPTHEDHEHFSEWAGEDFDPETFDMKGANFIMDNIKGNVREPKSNWK